MLAFDTHQYIKELQSAGFTEQQAEVQANALKTLIENDLATKQDIAEIKRDIKELELATKQDIAEIKRDIKELELRIQEQMKSLELRLTIRLGAVMVVGIGVIATLVKIL